MRKLAAVVRTLFMTLMSGSLGWEDAFRRPR